MLVNSKLPFSPSFEVLFCSGFFKLSFAFLAQNVPQWGRESKFWLKLEGFCRLQFGSTFVCTCHFLCFTRHCAVPLKANFG